MKKGGENKSGAAKVKFSFGWQPAWFARQFPHFLSLSFQRPVRIHLGDAVPLFSFFANLSASVKNASLHEAASTGDLALVERIVAARRDYVNAKDK